MPVLREGTSDARIWKTIYRHNEYGLLDATGRTVVDIGANIGAFTCLAADSGAARVVAVEPFGPSFEVLEHNAGDRDSIAVIERAFGPRSGDTVTMPNLDEHIEATRASGGVRGVNFGIVQAPSAGSARAQTIALRDLLDEYDLERVDVLKIDCEGAEWSVFAALEAEDCARIGEICGEYHLYPEYMNDVGGEPVAWLRGRLEAQGFAFVSEPHPSDETLGTFYARNRWVDRPACCFPARAAVIAAARRADPDAVNSAELSPLERLFVAFDCLQASRDELKVYAASQEDERTELRTYVKALKINRDRLRAKLDHRVGRLAIVRAEQAKAQVRGLNPFDAAWRARIGKEIAPRRLAFERKLRKLCRDPRKFFDDSSAKSVRALRHLVTKKSEVR